MLDVGQIRLFCYQILMRLRFHTLANLFSIYFRLACAGLRTSGPDRESDHILSQTSR